jgi:hypothetical protein
MRKDRRKSILTIYFVLLGAILFFVVISFIQLYFLSQLYSIKRFSINISNEKLCTTGPTYALVISSFKYCPACRIAYNSFINVTSKYGNWLQNEYYSPLGVCAYILNLSNINSSIVPPQLYSIYLNYSDGYIPFFYFNGVYYKIGGFQSQSSAISTIQNYVCLSSQLCSK